MTNAEEKQCGDCSLCCKLLAIPELNKPKDHWCSHVVKKQGCGIYQTRPGACRDFRCLWLDDARLPPEWKPTKAKFLMVGKSATELVVYGDASFPGAWRQEPYLSGLRAMAAAGQPRGGLVVIIERGQSTVLLADREVALGTVAPDERIVSGQVATPAGPRFEVKVMKAGEAASLVAAAQRNKPR